jgi:serine/threonine-protein kinase
MSAPSSPYTPPPPGSVLGGRYRIEEALGSGGMADVFRATELASGRSVAVKVLRSSPEQSPEATARLRREGQVLRSLRHAAIVAVEEVSELDGGRVMLVMEMLRGETLGARMRRGRMEPMELAPIVAGTAAGLAAAHANGVVHRDLKPDNIFLATGSDGRVQVKLLDFGVSKVFGGERLTQTGQVLGTPRYMSPEQLGAEPEVDHRVDVYALGVIMYEALAGKPPFLAGSPTDLIVAILHGKIAPLRSLRPELPASIEAVVMRAMARVRDARFRAATELADAFFEAAGIAPNAVARPRAGMATTPLGSLRQFDPSAAQPPPPVAPTPPMRANADALQPGTFSALPAFDEAEIRAAAAAAAHTTAPQGSNDRREAATLAAPAVAEAPRARAFPATSFSAMEPPPMQAYVPPVTNATSPLAPVTAPANVPRQSMPGPMPPMQAMATGPIHEPILEPVPQRGRMGLAIVGLAAGALTAGIAVVVLGYLGMNGSLFGTHAPPPPTLVAAADGGVAIVDAAADDAATAPIAEHTEPVPATATAEHPHHHHGHDAGTGSGAAPTTGVAHGGSHGTTPPPDPHTDPLGAAQRALSDGSAAECVQILSGLISGGGTPIALRRRADCLMRMGRRDEAIADYQRFCRIAPDHPSIPEVRETLEGMGRTCP